MTKRVFNSLLALSALLITSCDNRKDISNLPNLYNFATVAEWVDDDSNEKGVEEGDIYFRFDDGKSFNIVENKSSVDYTKYEAGQRVIAGVKLFESIDERFSFSANLHEIIPVITGKSIYVTSKDEYDTLADDPLFEVSQQATLTYGYLNLIIKFDTDKADDVKFYLAHTQMVTDINNNDKEYLELELRYDSNGTYDNTDSTTNIKHVSFNVNTFINMLKEKEGIALRVKLMDGKTIEIKVDAEGLNS